MGNSLFDDVVRLTGLPEETIFGELSDIVGKVGAEPKSLTIEQLRAAMLCYLEELASFEEFSIDETPQSPVKIIKEDNPS
ncbi:MAG TPA: hypothetical protein PLH57_03800 [Oligoflexia bacterium]|nr:hypothetical protein [Oligoflexia bacterium]